MSNISMVLTGLMTMALLVFLAPNIFALSRGHVLRNIALWLAVFLGLALVYQNLGPDSPHPLFQLPASMSGMHGVSLEQNAPAATPDKESKGESDDGAQGYTPPKE